jgi:uncharacterized Tic20 family protein
MTESTQPPVEPGAQPTDAPSPQPPIGSDPPPAGQPVAGGPAYGQPPQPAYGQPPQPAYVPASPPGVLSASEERTWAGAAHWSAFVASLVGLSFLGPLVVMVTQGNKSAFVRRHAVEALNFQISLLIYVIVSAILVLVLVGILGLIAVGVMWLIFPILATIKASNGEEYRYPLTIRMVS